MERCYREVLSYFPRSNVQVFRLAIQYANLIKLNAKLTASMCFVCDAVQFYSRIVVDSARRDAL